MGGYKFQWDSVKNEINKQKHGVGFDEAESVFDDPDYIVEPDEEHSRVEERFLAIGFSAKAKMLVVCHCFRNDDEIIRIISARKADKNEIKLYGGNL
ncbi:hypothetical protein FACS18949_07680 [Clostridia bacterium]|nr:hypothetical protein FACS18949_07680 [Clostridia bacterium]